MERYYKIIENEKLLLIGIGEGGVEISKEEYDATMEEIRRTTFIAPDDSENAEE